MSVSRRKALTLIGGGTILAATAGSVLFSTTRTPQAALMPWESAGTYKDPRKWSLSYALLAPNAHNRQPWLVELKGGDTVVVWRDKSRELPQTDPFHRQLVISLGCFLEQMKIAAAEKGVGVNFEIYPEGEEGPAAIATFAGSANPDPLFRAILDRRSCKETYSDKPLSADAMAVLPNYADIYSDPTIVRKLKDLTWDAWLAETNHKPAHRESVELMRFGKQEINSNPDGISLGGPFLDALMLTGMLPRESQYDVESSGFKQGMKVYKEVMRSGVAYAVITTPGNSRDDQIEAGRRWLRLNLATTELGVAIHPVSQALQEYPEMKDHFQTAHQLLAAEGATVQMLGRLGYGPTIPRTPRWPLESRII